MIPIQNLYYLLLYAWDALEEVETLGVQAEPETRILDLLAAVLSRGADRVLRRGLDRNYLAHRETITGIRGKLDLSSTVKAYLLRRGKTICEFDELSHDILHNQILKASLRNLLQTRRLNRQLRTAIRATYHRLHEVKDIRLASRQFRSVQLHRNIRLYRVLLDVCQLLHECLIPQEATGDLLFRSFLRDKVRMRALFERFIRNFFRREQDAFSVEAQTLRWERTDCSPAARELLPAMRTDVSLSRPGKIIVLDAKFYRQPLQQHYGRWTARSAHLYQMFAYLKNQGPDGSPEIDGIILYPESDRPLDLRYRIHGHHVRVCTINLAQHWTSIKRDLLALVLN